MSELQHNTHSIAEKAPELEKTKLEHAAGDVHLGEMLSVDSTPEQERKVVFKLDLM